MPKTYEPIASITADGSTDTYTFSSIPGTYTDLRLVAFVAGASGAGFHYRFNSDTGSNYSTTVVYGTGSSTLSGRQSSKTYNWGGNYGTSLPTSNPAPTVIDVMSYANTNVFKTSLVAYAAAGLEVTRIVNLWSSTSAITSMTLLVPGFQDFTNTTTFSLYGIKAA